MTDTDFSQVPPIVLPTQARWVKSDTSDLIKRGLHLAVEVEATLAAEQQHSQHTDAESAAGCNPPGQPLQVPEPRLSHAARTPALRRHIMTQPPITHTELAWAEVWLQRGRNKFHQGEYAGALANFQQALVKQPILVEAHNGLGSCLYLLGQFAEAARAYRQAIQLKPQHAQAYCNLGSALFQLGDLEGAVAAYQQSVSLSPRLPSAYYGLGVVWHKQGQYEQAIGVYRQALCIQPTHADSYYGLGAALLRLGAKTDAIAAYGKAAQFSAKYIQPYLTLQAQLSVD